jgi:hypothetical protein
MINVNESRNFLVNHGGISLIISASYSNVSTIISSKSAHNGLVAIIGRVGLLSSLSILVVVVVVVCENHA